MNVKNFKVIQKILFILPVLTLTLMADATHAGSIHIASWYGGGEPLNYYTASGEVFNPEILACASWDYPFNAKLKVTSIATGRSVTVRVNDRGPNKRLGRAIDLTKYAFSQIAETKKGLILVKIEKL